MADGYLSYFISSPFFAGIGEEDAASRDSFLSRFDVLSEGQRDLLTSVETSRRIAAIGSGAGLDDEQTEFLALVIREVVTGLAKQSDVAPLLVEHLQIDQGTAATISNKLLDEVLNAAPAPAPAQEEIPASAGGVRQLSRQSPSQEPVTEHIINLREEE